MSALLRYLQRHHVAYLALVVALGGTSYAAAQLPRDSVTAKAIKKDAVRAAEVKDGSLLAGDFAAGQLPAGPRGPQGPTGAAAAASPVPVSRMRLRFTDRVVGAGSALVVTFDQISENSGGLADLNTHPTYLSVNRSGVYLLQAQTIWTSIGAAGRMGATIEVRDATGGPSTSGFEVSAYDRYAAGDNFQEQPMSEVVRLAAGEQVRLNAYNSTSAPATLSSADQGAWLSATYLGP